MAQQYFYTSSAVQTTLSASLGAVAAPSTGQTVQVNSITGWPTQFPAPMLLEWGTVNQERVTLTQAATGIGPYTFANCVRGDDGTAAPAHASGAAVYHGVTQRDFSQIAPVYNVCDHTYAADPTGVADSTTAIQAAITAAANKGTVFIPAGTFKLSSALAVPSGSIILGAGKFGTTLNQTSTTANGITFTGTTSDVSAQVQDLSITGPASGSGYGMYGLINSGNNNLRLVLRNLVISTFGVSGMYLRSPITSVIENILSQGNGLHGFETNNGTSTTYIGNYALNNLTGIGHYFQGGTYWAMEGCASDYNGQGYMIAGVAGMSLNGCGCESINAAGAYDGTYYKISGSSGVTLNGCYAYNNSAVAYWVTAASTNVSLNNCTETPYLPGAPTASFKTDAGTMTSLDGLTYTTARALTAGTYNELNDGTTGEMSISGNLFSNAVTYFGGGSSTVYTATASTPALTSGTAAQINTTQDVILYANLHGTAATFSLAIGPTATPATTIAASATYPVPQVISVRVPGSWYVKSTFTGGDVTWTAVTC